MVLMYRCKSCPELEFPSIGSRDAHTRAIHQRVCNVKGANGRRIVVQVSSGQKWVCPYPSCTVSHNRPDRLQEHYSKKHNSGISPVLDDVAPICHDVAPICSDAAQVYNDATPICNDAVPVGDRESTILNFPQVVASSADKSDRSEIFRLADVSVIKYESMTLLLCGTCHVLLEGSQGQTVIKHIRNHSRPSTRRRWEGVNQGWGPDFLDNLLRAMESMEFTNIEEVKHFLGSQTTLVSPVPGLPIYEGFSCSLCNYHVASKRTMGNHKADNHPHAVHFCMSPTFVQCLVQGKGKQYFAVQGNATQMEGSSVLKAAMMKSFAAFEQTLHSEGHPPGPELSPFLRYSRWVDFAKELIPDEATFPNVKGAMLLSTGDGSPYLRLPDVVLSYAKCARLVGCQMEHELRILVRGTDPTDGFHQFLLDSTLETYCPVMTGFLLCLLRSACDPPCSLVHVVKAPNRLKEDLQALKRQLESIGRQSIQQEDFDYTILHELLLSLWTPPHGPMVQARISTNNIFLQYMILHTLKPRYPPGGSPSYAWGDVVVVTQMLSMLKHWCRIVVEMQLARNLWDSLRVEGIPKVEGQRLLSYVDERAQLHGTPFSYVCQVQKLACTIVGRTPVRPHLVSDCPDNSWCAMNGYFINLDMFRDMVWAIHEDCVNILREEVLLGLNVDWIQSLLEPGSRPIVDDLNKKDPGYCFLTDDRNSSFQSHKSDLCVHLFAGDVTRLHFVQGYDSTGNLLLNKKALTSWEAACEKVADRLNMLLHFTSGQPPRVTEYKSFLICNTPTNHRCFFWSNETLVTLQSYSKTVRSSRPVKYIVRFLPLCLRSMFLQYMCLVRPTEAYVADLLRGGGGGALYRDCWFISKGLRRKPRQLGNSVLREFMKHCNVPFRPRDYRHLAKFFSEPIRAMCEALRNREALDASAGHSVEIAAEKYAQNNEDMRGVSRNRWKDFLLMSRKWQEDKLHLPKDFTRTTTLERPAGVQTVRPCPEVEVEFLPPPKGKRIKLFHNCENGLGTSNDDKLEQIDNAAIHRAKHALSSLGHKEWKTAEQATAVAMAVDNREDFLAILPTGSGKSVIFQAAAQSSGKTVVVIVPLMMLIKGHMAECNAANIDCALYKAPGDCGSSNPPALVFVSAEIAISEHFRVWARLLIGLGKLHSIFIDEVHLVLCPFRPKMSQLLLLSGLQCQLVGLTASLRPDQESVLIRRLGRWRVKVIRCSTVRPNLQYGVSEAPDIDSKIATLLSEWLAIAEGQDRALVYCMTKGEVEDMQKYLEDRHSLHCSFLHSSLEEGDKEAQLERWEKGYTVIMVATGVIGCGYNYASIRLVLHRGGFYALHDYHQQSGRCSRDGQLGVCVVVSNFRYREGALASISNQRSGKVDEINEFRCANEWISNETICRRQNLHKVLDGQSSICVLVPFGVKCDVCSKNSVAFHSQPQPRGNGSQHWGQYLPPAQADGEGPQWQLGQNGGSAEWQHPLRPENAQFDANLMSDLADLVLVREHAGDGTRCLLCSHPPFYSCHAINECIVMKGVCYRCLGIGHQASKCFVKSSQQRQKYKSCYKCFFQFEPIGDTEVHKRMGGLNMCNDTSGERIRILIWHSYWNLDMRKKLRALFNGMPLEEVDFEPWLASKEMDRMLNNFVRVGAALMKLNGWG